MKQLIISKTNAKLMLTALALVLSATVAQANSDKKNFWAYDAVTVYPTGSGTVYMADTETAEADRDYQEVSERKWFGQDQFTGSHTNYIYAKPAEGLIFVGWQGVNKKYWQDKKVDSSVDLREYLTGKIIEFHPATQFAYTSAISATTTEPSLFSETPDSTWVALFGHVALKYVTGQNDLGTMSIEEPEVNLGEFTVIHAYPNEDVTFLYWIDDKGNKFEGNPEEDNALEIEVNENVTYYPVFGHPDYVTYDFGEGGYKVISYSGKDVEYGNDLQHHLYLTDETISMFVYKAGEDSVTKIVEEPKDTLNVNGEDTTIMVKVEKKVAVAIYDTTYTTNTYKMFADFPGYIFDDHHFSWGFNNGSTTLVYGKGLCSLRLAPAGNNSTTYDNYLKPSGDIGVNIADLPQEGVKYFIFNESTQTFEATTNGFVPANSGYLALPAGHVSADQATIKFITPEDYQNLTAGIENTNNEEKANVKVRGTFDLTGRKVNATARGLYIIDGKKVFIK